MPYTTKENHSIITNLDKNSCSHISLLQTMDELLQKIILTYEGEEKISIPSKLQYIKKDLEDMLEQENFK